jgi:cysteine desulfurase family protein
MKPLDKGVYLDNAATTYPKPESVLRAVERFAREVGGNPGRSGHRRALEAGREVLLAREVVARLLGVTNPSRIVFTKNATEALNIAIKGILKPGGHVIISSLEHNSIWRPVSTLKRERGVNCTVIACDPEGHLDINRIREAIGPRTQLLAFTHASNVLGCLLPMEELAALARERKIPLLVDAAQTAGRYPIDVEGAGIDLLAFTGHKELLGPPGTGGLYIAPGKEPDPLMAGGTGSHSSSPEQPEELPDRYEAGTLNAWGIAGLRAGVEFVLEVGVEDVRRHEETLFQHLLERLSGMAGVTVYGPREWKRKVGIISFNVEGYSSGEVAARLNEIYGIYVRGGLHCSPLAHRTMGTEEQGAVRVGLSWFNTLEEIDYLLEAISHLTRC